MHSGEPRPLRGRSSVTQCPPSEMGSTNVTKVHPSTQNGAFTKRFCLNGSFRYIPHMPQTAPVVVTIAGFDPSSGAGVTADIKTIAAHGCYGVAALTALTVQSTSGVRRCEAVDPAMLR